MVRPTRSLRTGCLSARARLIAIAVASCYATAPVWALNEADFKAVVGNFTPSQTGNVNVLTLTTATDRTLVETQQSFNVGAGEQFRVLQPSSSSLFLLRVMPGQSGALERSTIDGTIWSNGQFWLHNAAGALISKGAVIDTAGFLATNMAVRLEDFKAGRLASLQIIGGTGGIVNEGEIKTSSGGSVYLIGDKVTNKGIITTPGGETILAAGQTVNLIDTGTPGVKVEVTGAVGDVTNLGDIVATAGRIGMAGVIVRNSGTLNASSVVSEGGRVFLKASKDAYVDGAGRIVATGTKGGKVEVLGERIAVMDQAQIDVSGTSGGGTVLVGGDYQGKNPDIQNATVTYFGAEASIKADAIDNGDGGKVIVWADDTTRAYGTISARGGANGGNGGFVETSGHNYLDFHARVDTRAPNGAAGTLLLDPADVTISNAATSGGSFSSQIFSYGGGAASSLSWADIISQLGLGNVVITTTGTGGTGDITISASPSAGATVTNSHEGSCCSYSGVGYTSTNKLSLLAHNAVNINAWFGNAYGGTVPAGAIDIYAGWDGASTATPVLNSYAAGRSINIGSGAGIATKGALTLKAVDAINITGGASSAGIDLDTGTLTVQAEKLTLTGGSAGYGAQAFIRTNGTQNFTLGTNSASGGLSLQGGGGAYYGGGAEITLYGTSGSQSFTIQYGAKVELAGGSATDKTTSYTGECSVSPGCTNSRAEIRTYANGGQSFTFSNGGTLNLYGGSGGNGNGAGIENKGSGTQTITASAGNLNIVLYGGTSGGATAVYGGKTVEFDNSAFLESKTGTQTINAASLLVYGGTATYGGAFVTAPTQNINVSGAVTLQGGTGGAPAGYDAYGDAIWYNPAVIGNDVANTINMTVGSLTLTGGASNSFGGSMAMIGGYRVASNVSITSSGNVNLSSTNLWSDRIGSFGGYGGSVSITTTGAGDTIALGKAYVGTGSTGSVTLSGYGGISQDTTGRIEANSLTASVSETAMDVDLDGENKVAEVTISSPDIITYNSVVSTLLKTLTSSGAGGITVTATNPYSYGGVVRLGTLSATSGAVSVTAAQQILDDNGSGTGNITAQSISLTSTNGTTDSSGLAISADVGLAYGGTSISATVSNTATYGGISIRNGSSVVPTSVALDDNSTYAGSGKIFYSSTYDINMTSTAFSLSSDYGSITLWSGGFLTLDSPGEFSPGILANSTYGQVNAWGQTGVATGANMNFATAIDLYVGTNGTMTIGHDIANVRNIGLYAAGSLNFLTGSSIVANTNAYIGGAASSLVGATTSGTYGGGSITMTNSFVLATSGSVSAYSGGDIRLNDGSYLRGGQGVNLGLGGSASTLYLNDSTSYANPSYVLADTGTINIAMPGRSAEGLVIGGVATDTSTAYGSGFFVGTHGTPAVKDSNLKIAYGVAAAEAITTVIAEVVKTISTTTENTSDSSSGTGSGTLAPLLPPSGGGTSSLASLATGTVGGGTGEFGGGETTTGTATTTTTTTTSTSSEASGTSGTAESGSTSTSGDQNGSKESKDAKDEKKEDKKDDKSKKADSGEKKDDKAKSKPVGKCSA